MKTIRYRTANDYARPLTDNPFRVYFQHTYIFCQGDFICETGLFFDLAGEKNLKFESANVTCSYDREVKKEKIGSYYVTGAFLNSDSGELCVKVHAIKNHAFAPGEFLCSVKIVEEIPASVRYIKTDESGNRQLFGDAKPAEEQETKGQE